MAFGVKYRTEFSDELGTDWKVDFQVDPDPGTITTLQASGPSPMTLEWFGEDDIQESTLMGSRMILNVEVLTNFAYESLFLGNDFGVKVFVYQGENLFWKGYVLPDLYNEPYCGPPYSMAIQAGDGLGLLKDFKFADLGYTDRTKASVIIYDILSLIGVTSFTEYVNVFGETMTADVNNSPFDQFGIDPDLYTSENCYNVLKEILSMFNACIKQDQGVFTIYRIKELRDATMYGRIFTAGTTHSSTTKTPAQYIDRPTQESSFCDLEGGNLSHIGQAKTLYVNYDMNAKESCLKHWDFQSEDFVSGAAWTIPDWTATDCTISPISYDFPGESNGIYLEADSQYALTEYISQTLAGVKTRITSVPLSIDYRFHCDTDNASASLKYSIHLIGAATKYYRQSSNSWVDSAPGLQVLVSATGLAAGWSDWKTVSLVLPSIPIDGSFYIRLSAAASSTQDVNVAYRNIKLTFPPVIGSNDTGIGYTSSGATSGRVIEKEFNLGDGLPSIRFGTNQLLNYAGVINGYSGSDIIEPGTVWNTYTAGTSNGEGKPILEVISGEMADQYERPKHLIDLPLIEKDSFLSLTGNIQDVLNQYSGNNRIFGIAKATYDVRSRQYNLTLTEIL